MARLLRGAGVRAAAPASARRSRGRGPSRPRGRAPRRLALSLCAAPRALRGPVGARRHAGSGDACAVTSRVRGDEHLAAAGPGAILLGFHLGPAQSVPGPPGPRPSADLGRRPRRLARVVAGDPGALPARSRRPAPPGTARTRGSAACTGRGSSCSRGAASSSAPTGAGAVAFSVPLPGGAASIGAGWLLLRRSTKAPVLPVLSHLEGRTQVVTVHPPLPPPPRRSRPRPRGLPSRDRGRDGRLRAPVPRAVLLARVRAAGRRAGARTPAGGEGQVSPALHYGLTRRRLRAIACQPTVRAAPRPSRPSRRHPTSRKEPSMDESTLRGLIDQVKGGHAEPPRLRAGDGWARDRRAARRPDARLGRRRRGGAARAPYLVPTRRGGGGDLRILMWDAPTMLHPHFGRGLRDMTASRLFYEPLRRPAPDGTFVPVLAESMPTVKNGGLAKDGQWVIWRLKKNVVWHDGAPFTADDVIFNWTFAIDPANATSTRASFEEVSRVEKLDRHTVKVVYKKPQPFWGAVFTSGGLLPRHVFEPLKGVDLARRDRHDQAGRHRAVQARGVQARRHHPRRDQSHLPRAEPALLRPPRDQVRRRLRRARPAPCCRPASTTSPTTSCGGGRAAPHRAGRTRAASSTFPSQRRQLHPAANQSDPWTEVDGERSSPRSTTPSCPIRRCGPRSACSSIGRRSRSTWSAAAGRSPPTSSMRRSASARSQHVVGVQRRQGQPDPRPGGLDARGGRHPRQGRQAAQDALPGRRQRHRAEGAGGGQAGGGARGHRDRGQGDPGVASSSRRT